METYNVLIHPIISEKAVKMTENENKIVFLVNTKATKLDVMSAMKEIYGIKPVSVNIVYGANKKKAIIRLPKDVKASDFASKLGMV